jgi:chaperonin GroES
MTNEIKFQPLKDQVVIRGPKDEEKSSGGIILVNPNQDNIIQGTIVAIGADENIEVKVGEQVLFGRFGGAPLELPGEEDLYLMREDNIVGVLG